MPDPSLEAASELHADLRELRARPRSGLAGDDHDLVVADRLHQLVTYTCDGEVRIDEPFGNAGRPELPMSFDPFEVGSDPVEDASTAVPIVDLAHTRQPLGEAGLLVRGEPVDGGAQLFGGRHDRTQ